MGPQDKVTILTRGFEFICHDVAANSVTIVCERDGEELIRRDCADVASVRVVRSHMKESECDRMELDSRWEEIEEALG